MHSHDRFSFPWFLKNLLPKPVFLSVSEPSVISLHYIIKELHSQQFQENYYQKFTNSAMKILHPVL